MKKIININFQGRVIPIEETAYDILKQYIESLRRYFAREESGDEIINDIESRIAELFSDRLKRTTTCITDEDVNSVIASIGRPEDFEEAEGPQTTTASSTGSTKTGATTQENYQHTQSHPLSGRRLFRAENDKIVGGVAAGLANYFGIDPAIMRLLFVLSFFIGFGFLLYIILWIVVPSKALVTNVRKRLYRNPENRMLGGVSGGVAAYLNIDVWIPRIIFLSPFVLGVLASIFRAGWMHFDPVPNFLFNGFGGSLIIVYIILWIVLPQAVSATEKLEMRGEKVDLESIKKTVQGDFENLKGRAEKVGSEIKERAQFVSQEIRHAGQGFAAEAVPVVRRTGSGFGRAIGVLFKAFFLFVAGIIVFALMMALIALLSSGVGAFPFKSFILNGFWQNFLAWSTLVLFFGIPILALLTWLIRRIIGVRSRSHYLGYSFGSLWIVGLVSAILLSGLIARNFRSKTSVRDDIYLNQPASGKFLVKVREGNVKYYDSDWFGFDGDLPFFSKNEDSILMNSVRLKLIRSNDSLYHVYAVKFSNGNTPAVAEELANRVDFPVSQSDSILYLPKGFTITKNDKFRNQQVLLVMEIPVGKKIEIDRNVDQYTSFNINMNRRGRNMEWDDRWDNSFYWNSNKEYLMTPDGLQDTEEQEQDQEQSKTKGKFKIKIDENGIDAEGNLEEVEREGYRYKNRRKDTIIIESDSNTTISQTPKSGEDATTGTPNQENNTPLYMQIVFFR